VPTNTCLTSASDAVKTSVSEVLDPGVESLMKAADAGASARELELLALKTMNELARFVLSLALARRNRVAMEADIERRNLTPENVSVRLDRDYWMSLMTTVGPIRIPMYSYRDRSGVLPVTLSPGREVFPLYPKCRSTELCLEWESRLAGQQPFRKAEEMLTYFTHDSVKLEDTTIERHAVRVGHLIEQKWLYRSRSDIIEILKARATCDLKTGRPILYWSSDAHALKRFVNESWTSEWKMMNGLRLWCEDRRTRRIIHIGGEFTCGDAKYLTERMSDLLASGIVSASGDFGDGLVAQYVFVADGMPWFEQHLTKMLPDVVVILDAYHVMERLAAYTKLCRCLHDPKTFYQSALNLLLGQTPKKGEPGHVRKGHTKRRRRPPPRRRPDVSARSCRAAVRSLLAQIKALNDTSSEHRKLLEYIEANAYRMEYQHYRARGFQIGSGAMESLHRTGSQERLKRAGARWLPETLEGMFRLRMLEMVGRWNEWWSQPGFFADNAASFVATTYRTRTGPRARPNGAR